MPKVNHYCSIFFIIWFSFIKTEGSEEIPVTEPEDISKKTDHEKGSNVNEREINSDVEEDVYDDYLKILIHVGPEFRTALKNKDKIWENGNIPYEISDEYNKEDKDLILEAIEDFHNKTCVRFQERKNETSYISIVPGSGCNAVLGKVPEGTNRVTLNENCFVKGIVLHELMHALGFIHEQNRPDRDEFVTIVFDNIRNGSEGNFDKYSADEVQTFNQTYDYGSVMHYGEFDFAVNKSRPTIIPRQEGVEIGQRKGFSDIDLIKINLLYNCVGKQDSTNGTKETAAEDDKDKKYEEKKRERIKRNRWFFILRFIEKKFLLPFSTFEFI